MSHTSVCRVPFTAPFNFVLHVISSSSIELDVLSVPCHSYLSTHQLWREQKCGAHNCTCSALPVSLFLSLGSRRPNTESRQDTGKTVTFATRSCDHEKKQTSVGSAKHTSSEKVPSHKSYTSIPRTVDHTGVRANAAHCAHACQMHASHIRTM